MTRTVGVDIGATAVRVVEVAGVDRLGFAVVTRLAVVPLKEGAVEGGLIRNPQLVSLALAEAIGEAGVPPRGMVLGISTPNAVVTRWSFPAAVKRTEWVQAIRSGTREISPALSREESVIAANLIGTEQTGEGTFVSNAVVTAVRRMDVDAVRNVCQLARIVPRAVDLTAAATMRALTRISEDDDAVATVVDIGATKITVATRQGRHLRSIRTLPGGGEDLTRAIVAVTGESTADAQRRKHEMRLGAGGQQQAAASQPEFTVSYGLGEVAPDPSRAASALEEQLTSVAEQLIDQVATAVENDAANHGSLTSGVTLCGGTSLMRGMKERLQQRLGVPVQLGRPWAVLQRGRTTRDFFIQSPDGSLVEDPALMASLTTAVGLGLWKDGA